MSGAWGKVLRVKLKWPCQSSFDIGSALLAVTQKIKNKKFME